MPRNRLKAGPFMSTCDRTRMPLRINFHFAGFGNYFLRLYRYLIGWKNLWSFISFAIGLAAVAGCIIYGEEIHMATKISPSWKYAIVILASFAITLTLHQVLVPLSLYFQWAARSRIVHVAALFVPLGYTVFLALFSYPVNNRWVYFWLLEYLTIIYVATGITVWILRCKGDYNGPFWFLRGLGPFPETMAEAIERKYKKDDDEETGPQPQYSSTPVPSSVPVKQPGMDFASLLD